MGRNGMIRRELILCLCVDKRRLSYVNKWFKLNLDNIKHIKEKLKNKRKIYGKDKTLLLRFEQILESLNPPYYRINSSLIYDIFEGKEQVIANTLVQLKKEKIIESKDRVHWLNYNNLKLIPLIEKYCGMSGFYDTYLGNLIDYVQDLATESEYDNKFSKISPKKYVAKLFNNKIPESIIKYIKSQKEEDKAYFESLDEREKEERKLENYYDLKDDIQKLIKKTNGGQ